MTDEATMVWHRVVGTGEIGEDEPKLVQVDGLTLVLYKVGDGFFATEGVCTHEFALLSDGFVDGDVIECPLHQARFHIPTGKCLGPPADRDLKSYPVRIENDDAYVGLPKS